MPLWSTKQLASARRSARQRGLPASLSMAEWLRTVDDFGGRCAYCGGLAWTIDHFLAMRHGGGTTIDNCVPSCWACNNLKGGMVPDQVQAIPREAIERVRSYLHDRKKPRADGPATLCQPPLHKGQEPKVSFAQEKGESPVPQKERHGRVISLAAGGELILFPSVSNVTLQVRREGPGEEAGAMSVRIVCSLTPAEAFALALDLLQSISPGVEKGGKEQEQMYGSF